MLEYMLMPLKRYAQFQGRSRRKEYWFFSLFCVVVYLVIGLLAMMTGLSLSNLAQLDQPGANPFEMVGAGFWLLLALGGLFGLFVMIPGIAVGVRRLHDRDMSGWWYLGLTLGGMLPYIGWAISIGFLVLMCLPGTPGPNRFGEDPKDPSGAEIFA